MQRLGRVVLSIVILGAGFSFFGCAGKPRLAPLAQTRTEQDQRQVRLFDFRGDGKPDYREVLDAAGQVRYHEFDRDGDGTFEQVVDRATLDPNKTKHLFILLDGVPWSLIDQMWQEGYFRMFSRPGKMVSIFPSLTDPAYDQIFHCGVPYGYEAEFYDRATGRKIDGVNFYLSQKNEAWAAGLDYRISTIEDAVMYLWPGGVFRRELEAARKAYDRLGSKDQVVLYILSTDGICHMYSREKAREHFVLLDRWIEQIVYDAGGQLQVTMFADHGNNFSGCQFVPVQETLRASGLRLTDRLKRPGDVVAPQFGLINFASVFCYSEAERQRAVSALMPLKGIDLIAWRADGDVRVANRQGTARIVRRGGEGESRFAYQAIDGDPLGVLPVVSRMQQQGLLDEEGFAGEDAWFRATCEMPMPVAVPRVYRALHSNVINSSDLVISMADGYFYGDKSWTKWVTLHGTHGGLSYESTVSFLMSSAFQPPAYTRPHEILSTINQHVAWTPHIPDVDYAWLDQYRQQQPDKPGAPARIESASSSQPSSSQPAAQAAIR